MIRNLPLLAALFSSTLPAAAAELPESAIPAPEDERSVAYCEMIHMHVLRGQVPDHRAGDL